MLTICNKHKELFYICIKVRVMVLHKCKLYAMRAKNYITHHKNYLHKCQ